MGLSTGRDLHIDNWLSQVAINYRPPDMVADLIFPIVNVQKETDKYPVFSRKEAFSIEDTSRSRGVEAKRVTRSVSSGTYAVRNYALAYDLYIEDRANMDAALAFELDTGAGRYLQDKLTLDWDNRVLNTVSSASNVGTGFLTGSSWTLTGDPINQLWLVQEQIQNLTAQKPNSFGFGWRAWNMFRRNTAARNYVNGLNNGGGAVTREGMMRAFEIERFWVAGGFRDTSNEAQPANLQSNALADAVLVYFAPLQPSRETPSLGYTFRWTDPLLGAPLTVLRHPYDTRKRIEGIEMQLYQDERITGSEYGALLRGVGSAQANGLV